MIRSTEIRKLHEGHFYNTPACQGYSPKLVYVPFSQSWEHQTQTNAAYTFKKNTDWHGVFITDEHSSSEGLRDNMDFRGTGELNLIQEVTELPRRSSEPFHVSVRMMNLGQKKRLARFELEHVDSKGKEQKIYSTALQLANFPKNNPVVLRVGPVTVPSTGSLKVKMSLDCEYQATGLMLGRVGLHYHLADEQLRYAAAMVNLALSSARPSSKRQTTEIFEPRLANLVLSYCGKDFEVTKYVEKPGKRRCSLKRIWTRFLQSFCSKGSVN
mmetsp:Transcript_6819/g.16733  ORF Transcript_6819/g.16733 Transcript_6819/m.16733 type:complete len:270 (-) Transcript_6819:318-1127(-)